MRDHTVAPAVMAKELANRDRTGHDDRVEQQPATWSVTKQRLPN